MSTLNNSNEYSMADQAKDDAVIGNDALAAMQKAFDDIEKLENGVPEKETEIEVPQEDVVETADESVEDEVEEEVELPKEKILSKEAKYRKVQREKYKALAREEAALRREEEYLRQIEELKHLLGESHNTTIYHTTKSAQAELEKAKQDKRIAIESGDMDALINADIALAEAISALNEAKKWNAQIDQRAEYAQPAKSEYVPPAPPKVPQNKYNSQTDYDAIHQEIARDWLATHSYLDPKSRNYNASLAEEVGSFINSLDDSLRINNQMNLLFSEDYLDTIDEFIENTKKKQASARIDRSKVFNNHIGGVRQGTTSSASGATRVNPQIKLTADEKIYCANAGIPESSLIKQKLKYATEGK